MERVALYLLVGLVVGILLAASMQNGSDQKAVASGVTVIGRQAYRLLPPEPVR